MSRWAKAITKIDRKTRSRRRDFKEASKFSEQGEYNSIKVDKALRRIKSDYHKGGE